METGRDKEKKHNKKGYFAFNYLISIINYNYSWFYLK